MSVGTQPDVRTFLGTIWGSEEGIAYLAFAERDPGAPRVKTWEKQFYSWPQDQERIIQDIVTRRVREEVYYAPALFHHQTRQHKGQEVQFAGKEAVKGAQVVWVDFDDEVPSDLHGVAPPTIRIQSSPGNEHWYWRLDRVADADRLDRINRALAYLFHADSSGWDANQVLRVPETFNHKRKCKVEVLEYSDTALPVGFFDGLPEPPPLIEIEEPDNLPAVEEVVFKYEFPERVAAVFRSYVTEPGRGKALMFLGYSFAELNLRNEEILSLLMHADERWGKFFGRADRMKRLMEIVTLARQKYPYRSQGLERPSIQLMGFQSVLATEIHIEWVWQGWLQKGGYMLLTGPPGVGKTQFTLFMACMFALGRDSFGRQISEPRRIALFSLEMGLVDLKEFLTPLSTHFNENDRQVLEQNFLILPLGEPLYTNRDDVKAEIERAIVQLKLDGVMFDSLSSMSEGEIRDERTVKQLMDWNDHIRQQYGVFTWIVHHHRKATSDNKKPNKLDDVYGPYLLTARATSVFCLWRAEVTNAIEVIPLKVRLAPKPDNFYIRREPTLAMSLISNAAISTAKTTTGGGDIVVVDEPVEKPGTNFSIT